MKCRDRILGKVLNDDVAKVVMMFVGLWLLGTLMSHAQIEIWASGLRVVFDLCTLVPLPWRNSALPKALLTYLANSALPT